MAAPRGTGTKRQRRPGVWEIRIAAGTDPVTGRTVQRSVTFHGDEAAAEAYRVELAAEYTARRSVTRAAPMLTVGELLGRWLAADHGWKPSTWAGYRSNARFLEADPLARKRVVSLTPREVRSAFLRWEGAGASVSVIGGRFRVLRSAIGWAYDERIIDFHPIRTMRGPRRADPRRPLTDDEVRRLLATAETQLLEAIANDIDAARNRTHRHRAEQDLLLVRLAADTGARRGELAALRVDDLVGRVLRIDRAVSGTEITAPKSGRGRVLTVGTSTARLWQGLIAEWEERAGGDEFGPWLFSPDLAHHHRLHVSVLGHRFTAIRDDAGIPAASLHRLRHSVATFLVARGQILQAQARLSHADASTTLREYSYALPLTDGDVADSIDRHLDQQDASKASLHSRPFN